MRNTIPPKLTQRSNVNTPHSLQGKAYRDFCGPVGPIAQMLVVGSTALMKGPLTTLSRSQSCTDAYVLKLTLQGDDIVGTTAFLSSLLLPILTLTQLLLMCWQHGPMWRVWTGTNHKLPTCGQLKNEASYRYELVDAIRVCSSIHRVRVRPEVWFWKLS